MGKENFILKMIVNDFWFELLCHFKKLFFKTKSLPENYYCI